MISFLNEILTRVFLAGESLVSLLSFLLGKNRTERALTAIATPGLADLVVDVLGGGGRLGLGRLGDDGFPLLHCHDGSIEEGKEEKEGGERGGGEEWGKRKRKRKEIEKRKRKRNRKREKKANLSSFIEQTHPRCV